MRQLRAAVAIFWHLILTYELRPTLKRLPWPCDNNHLCSNNSHSFQFLVFLGYFSVVEISRFCRLYA
jgi:hypothetical protein